MKRIFLLAAIISVLSVLAAAQTTAFNFQGRLNDGSSPANGRYDLQFKLFNAISGGTQVGATLDRPNLLLVNGVFSTALDFGSAAFSGGDRFIEISLRPTGTAGVAPNAFVILGARQQIMSVPYSVKSLNATNADNATNAINSTNAINASNAVNADVAFNSYQLGGVTARQYVQRDNPNLPKAILRLDRDGNITRCYNAVTETSTGNCGFVITHSQIGFYNVDLGFAVQNLIVSFTTEYDNGFTVASLYPPLRANATSLAILVNYTNLGVTQGSTNSPINIVVY